MEIGYGYAMLARIIPSMTRKEKDETREVLEAALELVENTPATEITDTDRINALQDGLQISCHQQKHQGQWENFCVCNYGVDKQTTGSTIREVIDKAINAGKS